MGHMVCTMVTYKRLHQTSPMQNIQLSIIDFLIFLFIIYSWSFCYGSNVLILGLPISVPYYIDNSNKHGSIPYYHVLFYSSTVFSVIVINEIACTSAILCSTSRIHYQRKLEQKIAMPITLIISIQFVSIVRCSEHIASMH